MDLFFIKELCNFPILHIRDVATGMSATFLKFSLDMNNAARRIKMRWFDIHRPPTFLSSDLEIDKDIIRYLCRRNSVKYEAIPSSRHNKLGIVNPSM